MHVWRSDVVGSLLRPAWLQEAREQVERGTLPAAEFKRIEDRAVDEAVALQEAAGLEVITDGEMRRYAFFGHLIEAVEGFDREGGWSVTFRDAEGHAAPLRRPVVVGKLAWRRQMSVEEFTYLRGRTTRQVKVTLLSAQQAAAYYDPEHLEGRLCHPRRLPRRPRGLHPPRDRGAGPARLRVHPDRRAAVRGAPRRDDPRGLPPARQRSRPAARHLHRAGQRDHRWASRRDVRDPHLPRQPQEHVLRLRRLRPDRASTSSGGPASSASCSSTTTSDRGRSSRCDTCRTIAWWSSGWSARSWRSSNRAPSSSAGSRRPRASCRSSGWRSARSAGSRPRTKATA